MGGHLLIAGGNIKNNSIYKKFIELAGGENARIAIVPTAAKDSEETLAEYYRIFKECGVSESNLTGIKLDPDRTDDKDWKKSGDDFDNQDFLNDVKGIWFTGGDQIRIIRGLLRDDGTRTKLLENMDFILESGGVIGGSSAGAAIMSEAMIGRGTSYGALSNTRLMDYIEYENNPGLEEKGVLLITKGLGFLKGVVVDQHFDKRSRMGRLLEALFSERINIGYGISENSAAIYDIENSSLSAAGSGGITIIDISDAERSKIGGLSRITNAKISFIHEGDIYYFDENAFSLKNEDKSHENEYYAYKQYVSNMFPFKENGANSFNGNMSIDDMLELLFYSNEKKMYYAANYRSGNEETGFEVRLYAKKGYNPGFSKVSGSFINAALDILPVGNDIDDLEIAR